MHLSSKFLWLFVYCSNNLIHRYKRAEDAKMALEQMEGFELAGRTVSRKPPSVLAPR